MSWLSLSSLFSTALTTAAQRPGRQYSSLTSTFQYLRRLFPV
jgi:hypothetical protein